MKPSLCYLIIFIAASAHSEDPLGTSIYSYQDEYGRNTGTHMVTHSYQIHRAEISLEPGPEYTCDDLPGSRELNWFSKLFSKDHHILDTVCRITVSMRFQVGFNMTVPIDKLKKLIVTEKRPVYSPNFEFIWGWAMENQVVDYWKMCLHLRNTFVNHWLSYIKIVWIGKIKISERKKIDSRILNPKFSWLKTRFFISLNVQIKRWKSNYSVL